MRKCFDNTLKKNVLYSKVNFFLNFCFFLKKKKLKNNVFYNTVFHAMILCLYYFIFKNEFFLYQNI